MHRLLLTLLVTSSMSLSLLFADEPTDLDALRSQAAGGDAKAQLDLAIRYRDGKGVTKDDVEAMQWGHRAADALRYLVATKSRAVAQRKLRGL